MPYLSLRVVLDTNVLLAGLASESSGSQRIVDLLSNRYAIPLISRPVLGEYRAVLRLGHGVSEVVFQVGRIDISVVNQDSKTVAVIEVKRSIGEESELAGARRQGQEDCSVLDLLRPSFLKASRE